MRRTLALATLAASVTLASPTLTQPDRRTPPPRDAEQAQRGEPRPDWNEAALRERLQRRLEESERATERLREAIERLDSGDDDNEVARTLGREFLQDRAGDRANDRRDGRRGGRGGPRDRGEGEGFAPWRGKPQPLSAEEQAELRTFVQEHLPRLHERMAFFAERNPEAAEAGFARLAPRLRNVMQGFDGGPVALARLTEFQAGIDVVEAGRELRSALRRDATDAELAAARAALRSAVEAGYDARLAVAEAEIIELETRVAELRDRLASANQSRDADVAEKVDELTARMQAEANRE
ncbi:MAG: hypothetical protein AAFY58_02115 [Planctomycetota bacterium]